MAGFATSILKRGGDNDKLGARWVDRFMKRNPSIRTKISSPLESARARGSTKEAFTTFFDHLEAQIRDKAIIPANIANMDEHGLQELESRDGKVLGSALTKKAYVTTTDATTWVSIIECGTAKGKRLTPCIVFTGASLQGQWFPDNMDNELKSWKYASSLTGWSNSEIALQWLREVYLPETKPNDDTWRLLILDEHSSHLSDEFLVEAFQHKVQLLFLPPHTSHKTQPLDRSVFSALKSYFRDLTKDFATFAASAPVNKQRFLKCYQEASRRGMSSRNLRSGFKKTGIWPMNRSVVLDDPEAIVDDDALPAQPSPPRTPRNEGVSKDNIIFPTPQKSRDMLEGIHNKLSALDREMRTVVTKAAKSLDVKNAELAAKDHQIQYLQTHLASHKPRGKRKVKEGANDEFARIDEIIKAREASKEAPKRQKVARETTAVNPVQAVERALESALEV